MVAVLLRLIAGGAVAAGIVTAALAQAPARSAAAPGEYPNRPVRMIIPYTPGGPADIFSRILGRSVSASWGQQVVADNRAGANGVVAQELVGKSAPDGYTFLVHSVSYVINPLIYKVPYDNERDFTPVSLTVSFPLMLVMNTGMPVTSVKDLIALSKAKPGQLNYASFGNGSIAQLTAELFKIASGTDFVHIVYRGAPEALTGVIADQAQISFPSVTNGAPHVRSGRLKGLAVTSRTRSAILPEVPTMIEAGVPDFEASSWFGTFFPRGTPRPAIDRLHAETMKMLRDPSLKETFDAQAFQVIGAGPDAFPKFVRDETQKYERVVRFAKIRIE